jgi:hypothetical protein
MRHVSVSNLVSLDGFMAGPGGDIEWFTGIADTGRGRAGRRVSDLRGAHSTGPWIAPVP